MRSICNRHDNTIVCDECEKAVLERLEKAEARVKELEGELTEERVVCLCGCDQHEHESYGEDGECCGKDGHVCLRVAMAVAIVYAQTKARVAELEAELANRAGCINEAAKVEP